MNRGIKPTFVISNRQEMIDITLLNQQVVDSIKNWEGSMCPKKLSYNFARQSVQKF